MNTALTNNRSKLANNRFSLGVTSADPLTDITSTKPISDLAVAVITGCETDTRAMQLWEMLIAAVEHIGFIQQGDRAATSREWGLMPDSRFFVEAKGLVVDSESGEPLQASFRLVPHNSCTITSPAWELKVSISRVGDGPYTLPIAARYLKLTSAPRTLGRQAMVVETYVDAKHVQSTPWGPSNLDSFLDNFSKSLLEALSA